MQTMSDFAASASVAPPANPDRHAPCRGRTLGLDSRTKHLHEVPDFAGRGHLSGNDVGREALLLDERLDLQAACAAVAVGITLGLHRLEDGPLIARVRRWSWHRGDPAGRRRVDGPRRRSTSSPVPSRGGRCE